MDRVEEFIMSGSRVPSYSMSTDHRITPKQLCINLRPKDNLLEIPDFFLRSFGPIAKYCEEAIYNLHAVQGAITRKMIKGALADFMRASSFRRLSMVHMTSGGTYYGLPGVILDEDFHILMMTTFDIEITKFDTLGRNEGFKILGHNCRIASRVFENVNRNIEKMIVKKVIPFCASHIITPPEDAPSIAPALFGTKEGATMKVIIEDIDPYFIHTVTSPKISDDRVAIVKDIMRANISNILE